MAGDLKGDHYKPRATVKHRANWRLIALLTLSALAIVYLLFGGASTSLAHGKVADDFKSAASKLSDGGADAEPKSKKGTQFKIGGEKLRQAGENEGARMRDSRKFAADGSGDARAAGRPAAAGVAGAAAQKKPAVRVGSVEAPSRKGAAEPQPPKKGKPVVPPAPDKIPSKNGKPGEDAAAAAAAAALAGGKDTSADDTRAAKKAISAGSAASKKKSSSSSSDSKYDAESALDDLLATYPIILFSWSYCPHSARAKRILEDYDIDPRPLVFELDREAHGDALKAALGELTGRKTVPNLMVGRHSLGGGDEVAQLDADDAIATAIRKHDRDIDVAKKAKAKG